MELLALAHDGADGQQYRARQELLEQEADRWQRRVDELQQELDALAQ